MSERHSPSPNPSPSANPSPAPGPPPAATEPASVSIPASIVQGMIDHARAEHPNEACGLIVGDKPAADGGRPLRWEPTRNKAASPFRYEIDPQDLLRLTIATDDADEVFWAIVHSHVGSPARPSPTDLGLALYPDALYVLVSLSPDEADPTSGTPSVRAWRILDGESSEVELLVGA
jgi:[CysO sulfur-carrier protein]-S-L-cysteine hydrolase